MAGSSGRAGAPKAEARTLGWPAILAILALAAVVRGLRIWSVLRWSEDDTLDAIPAIQILRGTFPLFHVAVEYGGTAKSFVLALWFALAGISTAALDAFGYLVGLAGVWTSILLARRILPPGAALFAGLVLAVPSLHAVTWALGGNLMYPATFLLGNLILLLTHAIFFRSPDRPGLDRLARRARDPVRVLGHGRYDARPRVHLSLRHARHRLSYWAESVIQHAHTVDVVDAPPIVTTTSRLASLGAALRGLGLDFRETRVGGFVVLEPVPSPPRGFAALPSTGWTLTASHRAHELHYLVDRDAGTGWSTGQRQAPGQWLQVDLGAPQDVSRVDLLAIDWREVPAGIQVEMSEDGARWQTAVTVPDYWGPFFWSERHAFLKVRRGRVQVIFTPVRARFLRVTQTGTGHQPWAARELFVYRPAPPTAAGLEPGAPGAALRLEGVRFVYANHWLSARARVESDESIGALESNSAVNSYGRSEPDPSMLERFRPRRDRALLIGSDADAAAVRQVLEARGAVARERAIGPYRLLVLAPEAADRALARSGWRAQASLASDAARWAVDGEARTRWTASGPVPRSPARRGPRSAEPHASMDGARA